MTPSVWCPLITYVQTVSFPCVLSLGNCAISAALPRKHLSVKHVVIPFSVAEVWVSRWRSRLCPSPTLHAHCMQYILCYALHCPVFAVKTSGLQRLVEWRENDLVAVLFNRQIVSCVIFWAKVLNISSNVRIWHFSLSYVTIKKPKN